jgi:glycogen phosphorylase
MSTRKAISTAPSTQTDGLAQLLAQYGCGGIPFTGGNNALYERHLLFDNAVDPLTATPRQRYEALARAVRDILSQRWVRTESTYARENPKRV